MSILHTMNNISASIHVNEKSITTARLRGPLPKQTLPGLIILSIFTFSDMFAPTYMLRVNSHWTKANRKSDSFLEISIVHDPKPADIEFVWNLCVEIQLSTLQDEHSILTCL